jgi:hypothetical protein
MRSLSVFFIALFFVGVTAPLHAQSAVHCCVPQPSTPAEIAAVAEQRETDRVDILLATRKRANECVRGLDSGPVCDAFCNPAGLWFVNERKWCRNGIFMSPKWGGLNPQPEWYQAFRN